MNKLIVEELYYNFFKSYLIYNSEATVIFEHAKRKERKTMTSTIFH